MKKAPEAFRTISEVADLLDTPAHVLRFWESKFYQIRPVKRAGGRRYYRPDDVALINGIRVLLQDRGMTIRGVQRILQEQGVKAVTVTGLPLPANITPGVPIDDEAEIIDAVALADEDIAEGAFALADDPLDEGPAPVSVRPEDYLPEDEGPDLDPALPAADEALELALTPAYDEAVAEAPPPAPWREASVVARAMPEPVTEVPTALGDDAGDVSPLPEAAPSPSDSTDQALPDEALAMTQDLLDLPPAPPIAAASAAVEGSDRSRLARSLRALPRHAPGVQRDRMALLARRIDALLERMSEASGAGRW